MRRTKRIVFTLGAPRETRYAIEFAQVGHAFAATRQNLVRVTLVTHIPNDSIFWRIKHIVQCKA